MRVFSLNTVALVLVVLSLAVPTGAVLGGDSIGGSEGLVLSPSDGPNGDYASIDGNGSITVELGDDVNADAVTTYDDVFDVRNNGTEYLRVWVTHNASDYVEFHAEGTGSIGGEANGTVLDPGEVVSVGLTVDTHGASVGQDLIDEMSVHAERVDPPATEAPSGGSGGGSGGFAAPPTATPSETENDTVVVSGSVRIAFDRSLEDDDTVTVEEEDGLPTEESSFGIRPVITRTDPRTGGPNRTAAVERRLDAYGADGVAIEGETVELSGRRTVLDTAAAIYPARKAAAVYDITVSPRLHEEGATIWMTVNRPRFEGEDPREARVVRQHDGGWHVLETGLDSANATHVVLRARTPGFSRFAVLLHDELEFRWSVGDRGTLTAERVAVTFEEPGVHTARLAVTDGLGRRNETAYRLLVDDRPTVDVVGPDAIEPGQPVTLEAAVTNRFGETNVTWHFDDGDVATGRRVNRSFSSGEHRVRVRVEDTFGANATVEERFVVGERDPVVRVVEFALGVQGRLALIAFVSLSVIGLVRWIVDRTGGAGRRRRR